MDEYTYKDFWIVSGGSVESLLFFNPDYQRVVNSAIMRIMKRIQYRDCLRLICDKDSITIKDENNHEEHEALEPYDAEDTCEECIL